MAKSRGNAKLHLCLNAFATCVLACVLCSEDILYSEDITHFRIRYPLNYVSTVCKLTGTIIVILARIFATPSQQFTLVASKTEIVGRMYLPRSRPG